MTILIVLAIYIYIYISRNAVVRVSCVVFNFCAPGVFTRTVSSSRYWYSSTTHTHPL